MKFNEIAEKQGWNDSTLLGLISEWLGLDQYRLRDVAYFLQAKADAENRRGFLVEVVFQAIGKDELDAIHRVENQLAILREGHDNPVIPWTIDERGTVEAEPIGGISLDDMSPYPKPFNNGNPGNVPPHEAGTLGAYLHGPDVPVGVPCPDHPKEPVEGEPCIYHQHGARQGCHFCEAAPAQSTLASNLLLGAERCVADGAHRLTERHGPAECPVNRADSEQDNTHGEGS